MKQQLDLIRNILENGRKKPERTGSHTLSLTGALVRYDMRDGFPLTTSKFVGIRGIFHELLFFIQGHTNTKWLEGLGCNIWKEWGLSEDKVVSVPLTMDERLRILSTKIENLQGSISYWMDGQYRLMRADRPNLTAYEFEEEIFKKYDVPKYREETAMEAGYLGPVYGAQWRTWSNPDGSTFDQLKYVDNMLAKGSYSRRLLISGWNPSFLPEEDKSYDENIMNGRQALPSCHTVFQFLLEPMTNEEIIEQALEDFGANESLKAMLVNSGDLERPTEELVALLEEILMSDRVRTQFLNLTMYQRSNDIGLGMSYNVASYSMFLMLMAHRHNFVAKDFIHMINDAHLYWNQLPAAREQLERETHPLPKLLINPEGRDFFTFDPYKEDMDQYVKLVGYKHSGKLDYGPPAA